MNYTFRRVLRLAGMTSARTRRPRIHDLRHTFATRALEQCSTKREAVARHFVALATYLGHADIANTYWYLGGHPGADDAGRRGGGRDAPRWGGRMTTIAPLMTSFLREHMPVEQGYSPHTCETYAHAFRLLFIFASERLRMTPSQLSLEHIDVALVLDFLAHLEEQRGNGAATRNTRLAAIKAFMRYVEFRVPSALAQARQIHAIPEKRHNEALVRHFTMGEVRAILNAPNVTTRLGIRDRAMLHLCFAGALRVSELVGLPLAHLSLQRTPSIRIEGKGLRERCLPLWKETAADLRAWLAVRGCRRTRVVCERRREGHDTGRLRHPHQTCLRVDPSEKLEAMETLLPPGLRRGRFRAPDRLIASLQGRG